METTELQVINTNELQATIMTAPEVYNDSLSRADRVEAAAAKLLLDAAEGMNDELDSQMEDFLKKSKKSVEFMEEQRKPITQMAQAIVKLFTPLEKRGNEAREKVQKKRDEYATWKVKEAKRKEEEVRRKAAAEQERGTLAADIEQAIRSRFVEFLNKSKSSLLATFNLISLDNAAKQQKGIEEFAEILPVSIFEGPLPGIFPVYLQQDEVTAIREEIAVTLFSKCSVHFTNQIASYKQDLLDKVPSRINELKELAAADVEKAAKLRKEADERAENERIRLREEAAEQARKDDAAAKAKKDAEAMNAAFAAGAAAADNAPTAKGNMEFTITVTHQQGYAELFAGWFAREGAKTPLDKLEKMTPGRCKTYFENLATKEGELLESKFLKYEEAFKTRI